MEKEIPNSRGTTAAGHYNVQLLGKAQPKVQQWVLEGEEDPGVLLSIMSGFLAAKATARSPRVSPQNHAAVLAGSVPRSLGTTRSREPSPTTACHRCSSQARPCLLPNRRQRTPQRCSECLQVSPPAMSHNPLPGLTGQVPHLIAGSSRSEICYFGQLRNWEACSSGKPQQACTPCPVNPECDPLPQCLWGCFLASP